MHYVYIIYSSSKDKYYVGETNNTHKRLQKHNSHEYPSSFTKIAKDWVFVLNFKCNSKTEALFLEKFIKRMKSKKFILKTIKNPEILADILKKNHN